MSNLSWVHMRRQGTILCVDSPGGNHAPVFLWCRVHWNFDSNALPSRLSHQLSRSCRGSAICRALINALPEVALGRAWTWSLERCHLPPSAITQARNPCCTGYGSVCVYFYVCTCSWYVMSPVFPSCISVLSLSVSLLLLSDLQTLVIERSSRCSTQLIRYAMVQTKNIFLW